jgi:hypothetical protein
LCFFVKIFPTLEEKRGGEKVRKREKIFCHAVLLVGLRSSEIYILWKILLAYLSQDILLLEEKGEHLPPL